MEKAMKKAITISLVGLTLALAGYGTEKPAAAKQKQGSGEDAPSPSGAELSKLGIRIVRQTSEEEATHQGFLKFKEIIEGEDVGVEIKILPNAQVVGSSRDSTEAVILGRIDVTSVTELRFAPNIEEFYVFNMDYLLDDLKDVKTKLDREQGDLLKKAADDENMGIKVVAFLESSGRIFWNNVREVNALADLQGIKNGAPENPINITELGALGCIPTPMTWSELYTGLQRGTVDGLASSKMPIIQQRLIDVLEYATDTNHSYFINAILVSCTHSRAYET